MGSGDETSGPYPELVSRGHTCGTGCGHARLIRNMLSNQGISQESADIICKSWRKGTAKSYESAWQRWVSWDQQNTNPLSASLADILQFLTDLYKEGKEYSTVNTHCSAISMSHMSIDGVVVGKHPTVCRLMQGFFNSRPPRPISTSQFGT